MTTQKLISAQTIRASNIRIVVQQCYYVVMLLSLVLSVA